jgi:hypothetical protein
MDVDLTSDTNQFKAFIVSHSNRTINTIDLQLYDDGKKNGKVRRSTTDEQKVSSQTCIKRSPQKVSNQTCIKRSPQKVSNQTCIKRSPQKVSTVKPILRGHHKK